jgi:polyhydroxyalkanoate synthesis regulator phasin
MSDVIEFAKKTLLTGIGLALVAKDELEDIAGDLEKRLNLTEKEGKKFLDELQQKYDKTQKKLEDRVEESVNDVLKKANVATMDDLKALKKEIRDLKKAIGSQEEK